MLLFIEGIHLLALEGKNVGLVRELDYVYEVGTNPLLAYTMLHVIDGFHHSWCVPPEILANFKGPADKSDHARYVLTPSRFYRILFLIHKDCEKKTLELRLPYYWYKSGPVVHGQDAPRVFTVTRVARTQQVIASFDRWKDTILIFDDCESAFSDAILLTLDVGRLARRTRLDVIYEYSPSQLHKIIVTVLNELHNVTKKEATTEADIDILAKLLVRLGAAAVEERYSELRFSFEAATDNVLSELTSESDIPYIKRVIQNMWNVLSLGLRAKENANVGQKKVKIWKRKYAEALLAFEKQFSCV